MFRSSVVFLVVLSGCVHAPLHVRDTPADYAALGLTEIVVAREDGRRSRANTDDYEWWYLDAVASDGTVVVIVFSDNWLPGNHGRHVMIDVTPPGQPTIAHSFFTTEPGAFSTERADVRIGKSRFEGDLENYTVHVDAAETKGFGCDLRLKRRVESYRPGTGIFASGDDYFAWVVPVPEGELTGSMTVDGVERSFTGSGYHDHNWGNVPPWELMRNWWWGRAEVNGQTVVMAELRPVRGRGGDNAPLLFVAGPDAVKARVHGAAAKLVEGVKTDNEDASHPGLIAGDLTLASTGEGGPSVHVKRHGAPTTSVDLLGASSGLVRFLANISGRAPWYTRWRSRVHIDTPDGPADGQGTIEFMNFE